MYFETISINTILFQEEKHWTLPHVRLKTDTTHTCLWKKCYKPNMASFQKVKIRVSTKGVRNYFSGWTDVYVQ